MLCDPPNISRTGFLSLLERAIAQLDKAPPFLAGSIPCAWRADDLPRRMTPWPRMGIQLAGQQFYSISVEGKRTDVSMSPMRGIYWASNSRSIDYFHTVGEAIGIVLLSRTVRLIQVRCTGTTPTSATPWSYHTSTPLDGAGMVVSRALDRLADDGDDANVSRDLFQILFRLVHRHLEKDVPGPQTQSRLLGRWWSVHAYIEEHFSPDMSRESVAAAMELHPNYLSRLARQVTGKSFRAVLENIRMENAKRLLLHTDQKLTRIAESCGYTDPGNFSRAFRRITGVTPGRFRNPARNRKPANG